MNIDSVEKRIAKASSTFGRLKASVWDRRGTKLKTKLKVYKAAVLPTLLYACETRTVYERHAQKKKKKKKKKLNRFHINCLRKLLKLKWKGRVPDTDVLEQAGTTSVRTFLQQPQLRWAGHISRMPDTRLPKRLLFGDLSNGKHPRGRPKLRLKDTLKVSLKNFDIDVKTWEDPAHNHSSWRSYVHKGAASHKQIRISDAKEKRERQKSRVDSQAQTPAEHMCLVCGRSFRARIGLTGHSRTHQT